MREDDKDDEVPEDDDPRCPTIPFKASEKNQWRRQWRSALIVKVLGRSFPFPVVSRRLESLWAKCGVIQISSLTYGYYAVRFLSQFDYEQAAAGGPWRIGEYYLTVRPWRKNFNPSCAEVATTMVLARLPGLPSEFINKEAAERIAERIGRPIRVDRATQTGERGRYARVCVEVDLSKPLLSKYKIEGSTYYIEYEGLHQICSECGKYGHSKQACPSLNKEVVSESPTVNEGGKDVAPKAPEPLYGEWMMVKPKGKTKKQTQNSPGENGGQKQISSGKKIPQQQFGGQGGSRYSALVEEMEEEATTDQCTPDNKGGSPQLTEPVDSGKVVEVQEMGDNGAQLEKEAPSSGKLSKDATELIEVPIQQFVFGRVEDSGKQSTTKGVTSNQGMQNLRKKIVVSSQAGSKSGKSMNQNPKQKESGKGKLDKENVLINVVSGVTGKAISKLKGAGSLSPSGHK
ncbi:unnamed protein product [Linum tenue]|uniref:CCHC-type domain-containing protein n=1 Tax=Linum tenue TaxID=586396 RepID=A0AAV0LP19_9ROSI|nr:unnamed protein product [Linum tenue]